MLTQIGQVQTRSDDGRAHTVFVYRHAGSTGASPHFITNEGWEAAAVRDGVYRVYGTGLLLRTDRLAA